MARADVCRWCESLGGARHAAADGSSPANTDILVETVIYCAHDAKIHFKSAAKGLSRTTLGTCSACR